MSNSTSWLPSRIKTPRTTRAASKKHCGAITAASWKAKMFSVLLLVLTVQSTFVDQMYEIEPVTPIELPEGTLFYHPRIKAAASTNPGVFSYVEKTQTSLVTKLRFFDSAASADFAHNEDLSVTKRKLGSTVATQGMFVSFGKLYMYCTFKDLDTGREDRGWMTQVTWASKPFTLVDGFQGTQNDPAFLFATYRSMVDRNVAGRYLWGRSPTMAQFIVDLGPTREWQAKITFPTGQLPVVVDDPIFISNWVAYISRSGMVYIDDDADYKDDSSELTDNMLTDTTQIAAFYPKFAKRDLSETCTDISCHALVAEHRESPAEHYIGMLLFELQATTKTKLKFPHLDVTTLGLLSPPIQPANTKRFAIAAGTKFYSFKILSDRIERDLSFTGPAISGFLLESVVAGELELPKYEGLTSVMMLVANGASYLAKMFVFDTSGCRKRTSTGECEAVCDVGTCSEVSSIPPDTSGTPSGPDTSGTPGAPDASGTPSAPDTAGTTSTPDTSDSSGTPSTSDTSAVPKLPNSSVVWPKDRIRRELLRNVIEFLFDKTTQTRPVYAAKVVDLDSGKLYACAEVGCTVGWQGTILRASFKSNVQVTRGELLLYRTQSSRILETRSLFTNTHRILEETPAVIRIEDFQLIKEGWFFSWATVAQLIVFAFRTMGSLILFGKHPVVAMSMDLVVTHCVLLGLYLGPFLTSSEVVLQIIGQVKIIWYWYPNPFFGWDRSALSCAPRPNHGAHGVACSFLDNYGQNVIGFVAFGLLLTLLHYTAVWIRRRSAPSGRLILMCESVHRDYGLGYLIAKLDANQLEIVLYILTSYSLADSSSKSVVGLVLATILMVYFGVVAVGKTLLLQARLTSSPAEAKTRVPQAATSLGQVKMVAARYAEPRTEETRLSSRPDQTNSQRSSLVGKLTEHLAFSTISTQAILTRTQVFGPLIKLLRTLAVCILLLNHTSSAVAQLVIGIIIELLYLFSFFVTRTEEKWFDFLCSVGVQLSVTVFLILKAISTNSGIPVPNNQGGMAVVLSLTVFAMFATVCVCMICAFISVWFGSGPRQEEKIPKHDPVKIETEGKNHPAVKLVEVGEMESSLKSLSYSEVGVPVEIQRIEESAQNSEHYNFDVAPEGHIKDDWARSHQATNLPLPEKEEPLKNNQPQKAGFSSAV